MLRTTHGAMPTVCLLMFLTTACDEQWAAVEEQPSSIAGGAPDTGHAATVFLQGPDVRCSGSLIGPRTVVTAKHCVLDAPDGWTVVTGAGREGAEQRVIDVLTTAGDEIVGEDIAIVTLEGDLEVQPYPIRRTSDLEPGETLVLVGYGRRPSGQAGERWSGESSLISIGPTNRIAEAEILMQGDAASCHGDSGGSVLDAEGRLVGVISGGYLDCSAEDYTIASQVDRHLDLVREALPLGAPCDRPEDCRHGECLARSAEDGGVCTQRCEGVDPLEGCPVGSYCDRSGDLALCVPGWPGSRGLWDECTASSDCASLFCHAGQCREACAADADCGAGMHCEQDGAAAIGACFAGRAEAEQGARSDGARSELPDDDAGTDCGATRECASGGAPARSGCAIAPAGDERDASVVLVAALVLMLATRRSRSL